MAIVKQNAPHLRRRGNLASMLMDVVVALLPLVIFAIVAYTWRAVMIIAISVATMCLSELIFVLIKNKIPFDGNKHTLKEHIQVGIKKYTINNFLAPLVSALIFSLIVPAGATWWACFIGSLVGMVLGKLVFGGTGQNIFNPALVGMVFAKLCFSSTYGPSTSWMFVVPDAVGGATPLGTTFPLFTSYSLSNLFLGLVPGTMGETPKILILIGFVYLLIRREIDWRVVASYIGSFLVLILIGGIFVSSKYSLDYMYFVLYELLSGGLLFGAVFMITDPVTGPITKPSRVLYGIIAGVIVVYIRLLGSLPEGVAFSILIANMIAPALDYHKWSKPNYTWKHIVAMISIIVVAGGILALALAFGGKLA